MSTSNSSQISSNLIRNDFLRWFNFMEIVTRSLLRVKKENGTPSNSSITHINILNTIMRSLDQNNHNYYEQQQQQKQQQLRTSRRKMSPNQWGNIEENEIDVKRGFLREKSLLRRQLSHPQIAPTKPPKPDRYKQQISKEEITNQLQLFNTETQEMTYRVLELSSLLQERENQSNPDHFVDKCTFPDPQTRYELINRKLCREWWSSHSNLFDESPPPPFPGTPQDSDQYDLCLQHFVYFLHHDCKLSRRRSLDLARYFIQLGYYQESNLKEMIDKYTVDWLYDVLSKESHDHLNQFIIHEIELIMAGLHLSIQQTTNIDSIDCSDDDWDDKLSQIVVRKEIQSTTNDLLLSIQQQLSHLQGHLLKIDESSSKETKIDQEPPNLISIYERTLQNLIPSLEIPTLPSYPSLPDVPPYTPQRQAPENFQTIYDVDKKLTTIISGMYALYHQIDSMGIHVNQIQHELHKHENMLTSLLTEEYRVPKYAIIIPTEEISVHKFYSSRFRLFFICPITLQRANSGQDQQGYEITLTKEWVIKLAPAIKIGIFVARLALAYFGVVLPNMLPLPQSQSNSLEAVANLLDVCLDETSIIDEILAKSKTVSDLYQHFQTNKQFLVTAEVGFREIYNLLYSVEVDRNEHIITSNWIPKYTGLVLVHSPYDGTSEWVHESVLNQFKLQGYSLIHQLQNPLKLHPPQSPLINSSIQLQIDSGLVEESPPPLSPSPIIDDNNIARQGPDDVSQIILTSDPVVCEIIPLDDSNSKSPHNCCLVM